MKRIECLATLPELMLRHVSENGERIAAYFSTGKSLTYAALDSYSNQLANSLVKQGVKPGEFVGLCMERNEYMLISLLAIIKVGAVYVPMDPAYPADRLNYMAETAAINLLLMSSGVSDTLEEFKGEKYCVDTLWETVTLMSDKFVSLAVADDLAYVIFTSGSTGKPKGVKIQHNSLSNLLLSMAEKPGLTTKDRLLALTTLSFDIAVLELYLPLVCGATVVVANHEEASNGVLLQQLITQHNINVLQATPSTWRNLLAGGFEGGKEFKALCGGEVFPEDLAKTLSDCCGEVWNLYGPTETTVWSSCYRLPIQNSFIESKPILIGKPISTTTFWVLDEDVKPVSVGVIGELYIGGAGLAQGYLQQDSLTAERFIKTPLTDGLLYRTGDLVKETSSGDFAYCCRVDNQVKVRGFRIELGEIESALMAHPMIEQAVVAVKDISAIDRRLVAYIRFESDQLILNQALRSHLRVHLPEYMIPQMFLEVDQFPLTPNGKINRKSLPDPLDDMSRSDRYYPPETKTQKAIAVIWEEHLGMNNISLTDHFYDIGGHSLLSTLIIYEIEKKFNMVVSPADILSDSLERLADKLDKKMLMLVERENKNQSWFSRLKKSLLGYKL